MLKDGFECSALSIGVDNLRFLHGTDMDRKHIRFGKFVSQRNAKANRLLESSKWLLLIIKMSDYLATTAR